MREKRTRPRPIPVALRLSPPHPAIAQSEPVALLQRRVAESPALVPPVRAAFQQATTYLATDRLADSRHATSP